MHKTAIRLDARCSAWPIPCELSIDTAIDSYAPGKSFVLVTNWMRAWVNTLIGGVENEALCERVRIFTLSK